MTSETINDAEIQAALDRLAGAFDNMFGPMTEIADHMRHPTKDRMAQGGSPDGTPFAPRSPVTLARYEADKVRKGDSYGPLPLWRRGIMRGGIASRATEDAAEIGSNAIQAAVMQFGARQGEFGARMGVSKATDKRPGGQRYFFHLPWGDIPARPFLGVSPTDRSNIHDILNEWMERIARPT